MAHTTDHTLLQLLRTDYRQAFKLLYKEHYKMVEYLITKNSGNSADAEDVFQEAMIVLFNQSREEGFTLTCAIKTYIYSVARNIWLKKLRSRKNLRAINDYEQYENIAVEEPVDSNEPAIKQVTDAMQLLGENCRKILTLFYYQKMNMVDIAAQLGYTNADNAKTQKYKCLQQLKSKITVSHA